MGQPNGGGPGNARPEIFNLGPTSNGPAPVSFRAPKRKGRGYVDVFGKYWRLDADYSSASNAMNNEPSGLPAIPAILSTLVYRPSMTSARN